MLGAPGAPHFSVACVVSFFLPKTGEHANLKVGVPSLPNAAISLYKCVSRRREKKERLRRDAFPKTRNHTNLKVGDPGSHTNLKLGVLKGTLNPTFDRFWRKGEKISKNSAETSMKSLRIA